MKEDLLFYIWRTKRLDINQLKTTDGQVIELIDTGVLNHDAGPDFLNARIRIGDTLWAGNVEMHIKSSDWDAHQHNQDRVYESVILHVVYKEDKPIHRSTGELIPCLELAPRIPSKLTKTYQRLIHNQHWIPCQHHLHEVPEFTRQLWLDRMIVERLEEKTFAIKKVLAENKNSWEATFYQMLVRNFGTKVNAIPFELLAKSLPLNLLGKYKNSLFQIEALLFGQAGLLEEDFVDNYPQKLKKEFNFLKQKHQLTPLAKNQWKLLRMRPANFPTIRIAQLATLIHQSAHLFSKMLAAQNVKEIENAFEVKLSSYWKTHYLFDKESSKREKSLGKSTIHLFIINTIAPLLFLYGQEKSDEQYKEKALQLLEELPAEKNKILRNWARLGVTAEKAYESQALLQLKNNYCAKQQCTRCAIGNKILSKK